MYRIFKQIKQSIINWCIGVETISIGELHSTLNPYNCKIYDDVDNLKFIEQTKPINILVKTPTGFSTIIHTHKTVKYDAYQINLENHTMKCADTHIVILADGSECFICDLQPGVDWVQTDEGIELVMSVTKLDQPAEEMFDLELDDGNHVYYTDGIVSHNSITSAMYLLWYGMFNNDKTVLIASNKNSGAMEMIHRIRFAYEELPAWLKPAVLDDGWNKHNVGFDNGSRIVSTATSEDAGRGMAISLLFLDEFAFVAPNIQEEFWTSISPTLATGGSCIVTSTPNGDSNLFAQMWRTAEVGNEIGLEGVRMGFTPLRVRWDEPPGRDEKFKEEQISILGELKWEQEYACEFLSSDALLISSKLLTELTKRLNDDEKLVNGFKFWKEIEAGQTYLVGVDPSTGSGNDYSVIEVFHFPSMVQVAEYRENTMSSPEVYTKLKWIIGLMERLGCTSYFSIENNGVGEGMISLFLNDENPPNFSEFVSDDTSNRMGMNTNARTKIKACINLKEMVEKGRIKINSRILLTELKSFVRKKGSYEAQTGSTDDCISSALIIARILEEISAYEEEAFNQLYTYDEEKGVEEYDSVVGEDDPLPMLF